MFVHWQIIVGWCALFLAGNYSLVLIPDRWAVSAGYPKLLTFCKVDDQASHITDMLIQSVINATFVENQLPFFLTQEIEYGVLQRKASNKSNLFLNTTNKFADQARTLSLHELQTENNSGLRYSVIISKHTNNYEAFKHKNK